MKKLNNVLGLITLIVIIVLSMAACGDDSESDFDPGNSNHIDNNTLTWTVVTDSKFGSNSINSVAYGNGKCVAFYGHKKLWRRENCTKGVSPTAIFRSLAALRRGVRLQSFLPNINLFFSLYFLCNYRPWDALPLEASI